MAEVEVAAAPAPAAPTKEVREVTYDDSLLIKVKGKVKKPVKPDDTERNIQVQKLQAEITKYSDRIKEIKDIVGYKLDGAKNITAGSSDIRQRLQTLRTEFQTVLRQKQHIREELNEVNKQRDTLRKEIRELRDKAPGRIDNLETLDGRIKELEAKLAHESLSPADEKKLHEQLENLIQNGRPMARQYSALQDKLNASEKVRQEILSRLQQCDDVLNSVKAKEEAEKAVLMEVRDRHESETSDVPTLKSEQKECWDIIQACREKIGEVRKAYDAKYQEYIKVDRNYNAYLRHQRNLKYQERQKAREERAATNEVREASDIYVEPYESEIYVCDRTVVYLKKYLSEEAGEVKEEQKAVEAPAGLKVFKRKDDAEDDFYQKVTGKKGRGAKKAEKAAQPSEKKTQKLHHTMETLKTFMDLGVEVPQTTAEIPATIEKVEAKKEHYLELRKQAKLNPPVKPAPAPKENGDVAHDKENGHSETVEADAEEAEVDKPVAADEAEDEEEAEEAEEEKDEEEDEEEAEEKVVVEEKEEEEEEDEEEEVEEEEDVSLSADVGMSLKVDEVSNRVQVSLNVADDS